MSIAEHVANEKRFALIEEKLTNLIGRVSELTELITRPDDVPVKPAPQKGAR